MNNLLLKLAERRIFPDSLVRKGIRKLLQKRLNDLNNGSVDIRHQRKMALIDSLRIDSIAVKTEAANEQHYEVPAPFFALALGKHLKYSSCYFDETTKTLDEAEERMLALTTERAEIEDGMDILELGCGWGSLALYMAKKYPKSKITGVSNSKGQKAYILSRATEMNLENVEIITCDINHLEFEGLVDRIVSVEMFEHMRNYELLLDKIAKWLVPDGKLFVHIFTHRSMPYLFENKSDSDWMSRFFFTGGIMPSDDLLLYFQKDLLIEKHWVESGEHYEKTANEWLKNTDLNEAQIISIFEDTYGQKHAKLWLQRWRIFFMACAELWGFSGGCEWRVNHYLFRKY